MKLVHFVRVPHQTRVAVTRRSVFVRDGHRCQYCGAQAENIDHVVPRSRGGTHSWENVVACCRRCNTRKEDRLPDEAGFSLSRQPRAPRVAALVARCERRSARRMGALCRSGARPGGRRLTEPARPPVTVDHRSGDPLELLEVPSLRVATAIVCEPTSGALVLGSTQDGSSIDHRRCADSGLEVVRRRSGGAAVIVRPGAQVWLDVYVPKLDWRFDADVQASFAFLGRPGGPALLI